MAEYRYGSKVNSKWRAFLVFTVTTNNDTTYAISVSAGLDTDGSGYSSSNAACTLSGTDQTSHSVSKQSASGKLHVMVGPYTYSWTKGKSLASKTVTGFTKTSGGTVAPGESTATLTFNVPVKTSYTVSYNANGGSGAPGGQTKWYNETLTLQSGVPTRTNYKFKGWATSSTGAVAYQPGGSYTSNANLTLYAVWELDAITVKCKVNGAWQSGVLKAKKNNAWVMPFIGYVKVNGVWKQIIP